MDRLTIRNSDGSVSQPTELNWHRALEKLAAYEDTGLSPDETKAQQGWISVKDRLPEPYVSVLVYMPDEGPMPTVREGYLSECGFFVPALFQHIPVTHWAEMPEPPKEV